MRLMESFASKIDKLNGSNYLIWRDIAKCMLIEGDCWEITTKENTSVQCDEHTTGRKVAHRSDKGLRLIVLLL